jgi:PAS domain S-box-containing protein
MLAVAAFVFVALSVSLQYWTASRSRQSRERVEHVQQVIEYQLELEGRLADAALAVHRFALTRDARYLTAWSTATNHLQSLVASTGDLIRHPPAREHFVRMEPLIGELLQLHLKAIEQHRRDATAPAAEPLEPWRVHDAIRQHAGALMAEERRLLAANETEALRQDRRTRLALQAGGALALALFGVATASLVRENRRRRRAEANLHEANTSLEARVAERTAQLSEQKQRLQAVVDTAVEGIITINERGIVDSMNDAAERMFGYRADEVIGRNVSLLMPAPYREHHDGYLARYLETGQAKIIGIGREVMGQRQDGTVFPLDLSVSEVKLGERRIFTGLVRDLTERKRLEAAVTSSAEQERGRIARDLHDGLGQELGGALFLSNLLQRDLQEHGAPEAERAAQIHGLVEKALADVREISRGLYPVPPEPDGLMTALQNLADRVTRDCRIECAFDADSAVLLDDPILATHLYRIAQEAVNNALKHSGGSRIDIRLASTAHSLEVSVRDHGTGLPQNPPASNGLGWQTMKHRAQLIGGRLSVQNVSGGGALISCAVTRYGSRPAEAAASDAQRAEKNP